MSIGAAIIGSSVLGAIGSSRAASAQERAAGRMADVQERVYEENVERFQPYYDSGITAQNALMYELGLGPRPGGTGGGNALSISEIPGTRGGGRLTVGGAGRGRIGDTNDPLPVFLDGVQVGTAGDSRELQSLEARYGGRGGTPTRFRVGDQTFDTRDAAQAYIDSQPAGSEYQGFRATPGYEFRLNEGVNALDASAASGGGLFSGASARALTEFGQNIGAQEYGNWLNRITGVAASGQNAAGQQAAAGQNFATGMTNAYGAMGNAQAAGAIGMSNAINSGVNNWLGYQQFSRLMG